jgi:AcrR family transcriptional regulator
MARQPAPGTRERILDVATRLFYERGVHESGLQQVIDECGCGKNLLYREFPSKDDLVVAYLERRREQWTALFDAATQPLVDDPAGQLVAIVRALAEDTIAPDFRGCPFLKINAEFPDDTHPAHRLAVEHFNTVREQLRDIAERAGAGEPDVVADRLLLIIHGLAANVAISGNEAAAVAVALAEQIVTAATPPLVATSSGATSR